MGELRERIGDETNSALKAGEKTKVSALRLLSAAVKNREVEVQHELDDEEVREIATREAKKRKEAIDAYEKGGRPELVEKEAAQLEAIAGYLPEQLSDEELDALIDEAVTSAGATSIQEMGKVMGLVMGKAKGKADGKVVQEKVKARLAG
ncbi:MAG: GatB/YqeY domain-containing protein [Actinomycetota bacterium]